MLALRRAVVLAAVCGAVLAVSACSPAASRPTPSPTTPIALTDAEAFAAAEETYRAYVDALNSFQRGDANATTAAFDDLLTSTALEEELRSRERIIAEGLALDGLVRIASFTPASASDAAESITAQVCLDVSATRLLDASGNDVTPGSRPEIQALKVTFTPSGDRIDRSEVGNAPCS